MIKMKLPLLRIGLVLVGLAMIVSGCTSNGPSQPQGQGQMSKELIAESRVPEHQGGPEAGQPQSGDLASQTGSDVAANPQGELNVIECVQIEPSSPVTGDQVVARVSLASSTQVPSELVYRWKKNGQAVQESRAEGLQAPLKREDFVEVEVLAAQSSAASPKGVSSSVMVGNAPPTMRLASQAIGNEGAYQAKVESSDPEGDNYTLSIKEGPSGMTVDPGGNIRWTLDSKAEGTFSVAISARDVHGAETVLNYQIKVHREQNGKAS